MNIKNHRPLIFIFLWSIILILVLQYWPREIQKETQQIITIHYISIPQEILETEKVEEPKIEITPESPIEKRYGFSYDDIYLMTVLLCGSELFDGDGEYDIDYGKQDNYDQISLVLSVVMNRVMSNEFPNTVQEVIWAPNQFSPMKRWSKNSLPSVNQKSYAIVKEWCEAYDNYDLSVMSIPETHLYFTGDGKINRSRERW